ncbi:MAG TPA: hypothetical protein VJ398_08945 [Acidimicrobiia bacterium]|nr:hypothetical protein [Acidimicrobiia bacterium]
MTKRTLMLTGLVLALVAVPAAALALQTPRQNVEAPTVDNPPYPFDRASGSMGDMHNSMWNNPDGTLPQDTPYGWMDDMHDWMWNTPDGTLPEGLSSGVAQWMDHMRDWWWGNTNGAAPRPVPEGQGLVPSQYRVPAVTQDGRREVGTSAVSAGWNGGGCGMWGNR